MATATKSSRTKSSGINNKIPIVTFYSSDGADVSYRMILESSAFSNNLHVWTCRFGIYKLVNGKHPIRCRSFEMNFIAEGDMQKFMSEFHVGRIERTVTE